MGNSIVGDVEVDGLGGFFQFKWILKLGERKDNKEQSSEPLKVRKKKINQATLPENVVCCFSSSVLLVIVNEIMFFVCIITGKKCAICEAALFHFPWT